MDEVRWFEQRYEGNRHRSFDVLVAEYRNMSKDTEAYFVEKAQGGCFRSRDILIHNNLGFLCRAIYEFVPQLKRKNKRHDVNDFLCTACVALMEAIEKFESGRGHRLISYARYWVRQHCQRQFQGDRLVRVSTNHYDVVYRYLKGIEQRGNVSEANINSALENVFAVYLSMDRKLFDEDFGVTLHELMADEDVVDPLETIIEEERVEKLNAVLETLPARQKEIVERYWGLNGLDTETYLEIGEHFDISKERVRQVYTDAMATIHKRLSLRGLGTKGENGYGIVMGSDKERYRYWRMEGERKKEKAILSNYLVDGVSEKGVSEKDVQEEVF